MSRIEPKELDALIIAARPAGATAPHTRAVSRKVLVVDTGRPRRADSETHDYPGLSGSKCGARLLEALTVQQGP